MQNFQSLWLELLSRIIGCQISSRVAETLRIAHTNFLSFMQDSKTVQTENEKLRVAMKDILDEIRRSQQKPQSTDLFRIQSVDRLLHVRDHCYHAQCDKNCYWVIKTSCGQRRPWKPAHTVVLDSRYIPSRCGASFFVVCSQRCY